MDAYQLEQINQLNQRGLKYSLQNDKLEGMDHEFSEEAWNAFHGGDINDQDDFYTFFYEWVDNAVKHDYQCKAILEDNMEYCFDEHDVYGRPNNIHQAAYACLYDYLMHSLDTVTFGEMEEVLND